ncbi:MAG: MFS transporter [Terrimonas sp.]|nr:MFS transporter [Terrimonas sp.]
MTVLVKKIPKHILPLIIISQFAGTSLWFVGNAVLPDLKASLGLSQYAVSQVTSAVMIGFICGTLVFAFFSLADRFSPVKLFFASTLFGAFCNAAVAWWAKDATSLLALRFLTGFFLAGIYPVGMKIAADWFDKRLGKALGFLLGALILGTAFPHLLKNRDFDLPWRTVLYITSLFALIGALLMMVFVGDGPSHIRSGRFKPGAIREIFSSQNWRRSAMGYFGHMWELYTFWGFLPVILELYNHANHANLNIPILSFLIIGAGSISSVSGGYLSQKIGSAKTGSLALLISGICCLASPLFFQLPVNGFIILLFIWGLTVSPDSPQFSTLVAQYAPGHLRGTALTIYNAIGFSISVLSLYLVDRIFHSTGIWGGKNSFVVLGLGALTGLPFMYRLIRRK